MRDFELASNSAPAYVRERPVLRDQGFTTPAGEFSIVLRPVGPPRMWPLISESILGTIHSTLGPSPTPSPHLMQSLMNECATRLSKLSSQFIEPNITLDACLVAVMCEPPNIHVALTAGMRLFRTRGQTPEQLFSKAQRPVGLASGVPFHGSTTIDSGDFIVFGSRGAFELRSVGMAAQVLSSHQRPPLKELCNALIDPCRDVHAAAHVIALRW